MWLLILIHSKVDSTNNRVGVGTTSPATALDVLGTIRVQTGTNDATGGEFSIDTNVGHIRRKVAGNGVSLTSYDDFQFYVNATGGSAEGGTQAMIIDNSGNVGIGTTSPGKLLHVETPVNTSENLVRIASSMNNGLRSISGIEFVTNPQFYNADNGQRTPGCIKSGFYSDGVAGLIANWPDSYITLQTTITGALVDTLTCRGGNVGIGTTGVL